MRLSCSWGRTPHLSINLRAAQHRDQPCPGREITRDYVREIVCAQVNAAQPYQHYQQEHERRPGHPRHFVLDISQTQPNKHAEKTKRQSSVAAGETEPRETGAWPKVG